jgi:hypothetical protein
MTTDSILNVLTGLEDYLKYKKSLGYSNIEIDKSILESLRDEHDCMPDQDSEIKVESANNSIFVEGCKKNPAILFIYDDVELEGASEKFNKEKTDLLDRIVLAMKQVREEVGVIKSSSLIDYSKDEIRNLIIDIAPRASVIFGPLILENLYKKNLDYKNIRGVWLDIDGIKIMPTHSLRDILNDLSLKKESWKDLQLVINYLA